MEAAALSFVQVRRKPHVRFRTFKAAMMRALCLPGSPPCDPMPLISDPLHRLTLRVSLQLSKSAFPTEGLSLI